MRIGQLQIHVEVRADGFDGKHAGKRNSVTGSGAGIAGSTKDGDVA